MKRIIPALLTAVLLLAASILPAYGAESPTGCLDVVLKLDYRESGARFAEREITLTLAGRDERRAEFLLTGSESDGKESFDFGGSQAAVRFRYHNPEDTPPSPATTMWALSSWSFPACRKTKPIGSLFRERAFLPLPPRR